MRTVAAKPLNVRVKVTTSESRTPRAPSAERSAPDSSSSEPHVVALVVGVGDAGGAERRPRQRDDDARPLAAGLARRAPVVRHGVGERGLGRLAVAGEQDGGGDRGDEGGAGDREAAARLARRTKAAAPPCRPRGAARRGGRTGSAARGLRVRGGGPPAPSAGAVVAASPPRPATAQAARLRRPVA